MEQNSDTSSDNETCKHQSSSESSSSLDSSDETCKQLPKRYKLPLRSDFQPSEISHQTLIKYQSKLDEHANKSYSQELASSSSAAESSCYSAKTHDVSKRDDLETPPAADSHEDFGNIHTGVSTKSGDENKHSVSSQQKIKTLNSTLNEVITESRKKRQNNVGSIDDYYPAKRQPNNESDEPNYVSDDENEGREQFVTSSDDEVITEDESELEEEKDDGAIDEKSQKYFDKIMFAESNLTVRDVIVIITALSLNLSMQDKAKLELAEAIKILAGKKFQNLNLSKYMMNKCFSAQEENMTYHFYCENCKKVILYAVKSSEKKGNRETYCNACKKKQQTTSSSTNYVLSLDLKYQMNQLLLNPVLRKDIFSNLKSRNVEDDKYKDVHSGSIHKTIVKECNNDNEYMLTVNASTDGAPLTKSGKTGFWPVQVILNDLSPKLRFKNVLLSGLLLTPTEPKSELLNLYLEQVYVKQIQQLFEEGIEIVHEDRKITLKFCTHAFVVDAVARAIVQNRIQFNGYFGCSWCYQLGEYFQTVHGVRYPVYQDGEIRTHQSHMDDVDMAKCGKVSNGVKGPCALEKLPFFNMIWSFPYEYLHALLFGGALTILNEWKNGDSVFKLSKAQIDFIEKRFLQIKPTSEVHRLPRSGILKGSAKPKGVELKSWLAWYSLPCLYDVLNEDALKHFSLLVKCSYTLLSTTATSEELDQCEIDLLTFVIEYAKHYGEDKITYNIHVMLHIVDSVRKTGPITCNSAFPFESFIYILKKFVNGPKGMDKQIARKHLQTLVFKTGNIGQFTSSEATINFCTSLFDPIRFSKSFHCGENIVYCGKREIQRVNESDFYFLYKKCIHDGTVYHSEDYKQNTKTDNFNVQLHSGDYGKIVQIVDYNSEPYLKIRLYKLFSENPFENVNHIKKIKSETNKEILISFNDVKCKVMLVNVRNGRYLCHLPNTFEIQ